MQRFIHLAILSVSLLLLPACFDYEAQFTLRQDGSGQVAFTVKTAAACQVNWNMPLVSRIIAPEPVMEQPVFASDEVIMTARTDFKLLGDLLLSKISWSLRVTDTGFLGMTDYTYRLTATVANADGIAAIAPIPSGFERDEFVPEEWRKEGIVWQAEKQARQLRTLAAGEHMITINQTVFGPIKDADSIIIGEFVANPHIDGNTVSWHIPLAQLVKYDIRANLGFSCTFKGDYLPSQRNAAAWSSKMRQPSLYPN